MSEQTFLLSTTPTTEHRITMEEDTAVLSTTTRFVLGASEMAAMISFLRAVKMSDDTRLALAGNDWTLVYDPDERFYHFSITRRATGRAITMSLSTAYKLLDALTGKTDRLVKEVQP